MQHVSSLTIGKIIQLQHFHFCNFTLWLPERHANCLLLHPLNAGVRNLFTITGRMNGGLSLAGCTNNWFKCKTQPLSNYMG